MKKNELRKLFFKSLLLFVVSLSFASCSNLFGVGDSGSSSSEAKPAEVQNQPKTITITGDIKITEELKDSGAIPEEYRSLFSSIDNSHERTAFPAIPTTGYYVTATDGETTVDLDSDLITITANGASFTMTLPADNPDKVWTVEAGIKAAFNGSEVVILKDTFEVTTPPTFYHEFVIRPLASGKGNVDLTINYETANTADELELHFGSTQIVTVAANGETLSSTKITLKNRDAGSYKAKLVFKKNGYVVYTDYQGINIFPNMTTNTWVSSGGNGPIIVTGNTSTYKITDDLMQDYLLTQIYVGNTTIGETTITASDETGNGTVFAPFEKIDKAINYLQTNGNTGKDYTIWISGEITGAQTISDVTNEDSTPVLAKSLTISGVTGSTTDILKGGSSGSVLLVDTEIPVSITKLKITGGKGTSSVVYSSTSKKCGGGLNVKKGTVTLSTDTWITGNYAEYGGGVYVASGAKLFMTGNSVVGDLITDTTTTASGDNYTTFENCANYATLLGGGIYVNGGELYLGYKNGTTIDNDFTGGVNRNACPKNTIPQEAWGGGIYFKGPTFRMSNGTVSYNYAKISGGGLVISAENTNFYFSGGKISNNTARSEAGGVYLRDKANLFMSGSALIGDTGKDMTDSSKFSNQVSTNSGNGGGAIYTEGAPKLYLGYTDASHTDANFTGGICHNYSANSGGAINLYNAEMYMTGGNIKYNSAAVSGGGLNLSLSSKLNLTSGTFSSNTCGTDGNGGAINYAVGTFNFNGGAIFSNASEKNNDIYIGTNNKLTFSGTETTGSAKITPYEWTRGKQLFAPASGITITDDMLSQFSLTDSDWSIVKSGTGTSTVGKIDCPIIYVAGDNRNSKFGDPSDTNGEGTIAKPYESIEKAATVCWTNETDYRIIVSGAITGAAQSIPSTVTAAKAKTITIEGCTGSNTDKINRALSEAPGDSTSGTALTISTAVPVTIKNLTITGGYATGTSDDDKSGGGIKITAGAQVTLEEDSKIEKNYAQSFGGGVYLSGTNAKLTVKTGAIIGVTSSNSANSSTNCSNYAGQHGGGICADNGANVIISGGTISYNFAGSYGGALAVKASQTSDSTATISGSPSITRCGGNIGGGALYISGYGSKNKNATVSMSGGTIDNCYASDSYSSIQLTASGVLELGKSVSIPYSNSDTKNYIYMSCAGWSQNGSNVYGIGSIKFISELSNHNSLNKIKVYVQGTEDYYKDLADITALSSDLLTSELPKIDINNSLTTGYAQQLFAKDTTLDSTGKSAYYRHYRGTKLPTATKGIGYIMFNDGSSTPYSNGLSLHNDQKAAAVAVIFKVASGKAYGVGLKQEPNHGAWADSEDTAIAFTVLTNAFNEDNGKTCMQAVKDRIEDLIGRSFSSTTFPAMWWASHYEESITNEGIYTSGWYLPAKNELKAVYDNKSTINSVITLLTSTYADSYITENNYSFYWSATNASDEWNGNAWCIDFSDGSASSLMAPTGRSSVAIREF